MNVTKCFRVSLKKTSSNFFLNTLSLQLLFLIRMLFSLSFANAQENLSICKEIENTKAVKLYQKGIDKKKYDFKERKEFLLKAIEEEPEYAEAQNALGNCAITIAKGDGTSFAPAKKYFEKAIEICADVNPYAYFYLGLIAYGNEEYEATEKNMKKFTSYDESTKKDEDYNKALKILKEASFLADIYKNPVPFDPKPLKGICTYEDEFLAMMSPPPQNPKTLISHTVLIGFRKPYQSRVGIVYS